MKISPVNNYRNIQKNHQSFNGLWGKTSINTDYDESLGIPKIEHIFYYYPFKNESQASVDEIVRANTYANIEKDAGGISKYVINECKVCATLPFDDKSFQQYKNADDNVVLSDILMRINRIASKMYCDNSINQSEAQNMSVAKKAWEFLKPVSKV